MKKIETYVVNGHAFETEKPALCCATACDLHEAVDELDDTLARMKYYPRDINETDFASLFDELTAVQEAITESLKSMEAVYHD